MKLSTKIVVSFVSVVLAPILLLGISAALTIHFQSNTIRSTYGISRTSELFSSNVLEIFTELTSQVKADIQETLAEEPDALLREEKRDQWQQILTGGGAYLIVSVDGEIVYDGRDQRTAGRKHEETEESREEFYRVLPTDLEDNLGNRYCYIGLPWQCLISTVHFGGGDSPEGVAYLVTSVRGIFPNVRSVALDVVIMVVLVLVITAMLLTMWLYSSVLRPLATLQKATRAIRDGNLDFSLEVEGKDEISELCRDFEDMRVRLKATAEEKLQYDRENKVLISNISHDLKTPLTAVKGYCEGILDGVANTPEKLEKYIRTIYNKAGDMQRLIDELTLYSKIDTNRIPYNFEKISVSGYFSDCAEELAMDLSAQNIEMTYSNYLADDVMIIGDAEQLKRVVNNIISNSIKYMDKKKGFISLRLRDEGDFVRVEIEDNGKGIATRDLPYIFDRFYRTDSSRNSATGGSGIGLSIVKKIIEDHGGRIWATSKEGTGTIMHFVLRKYQEAINE